jgi:proline dehydrogenase
MINKVIAYMLPYMPKKFVWLFSRRYIAGETLDEAIDASRKLGQEGIEVTVDLLGEYITTMEQARENKIVYFSIIERFEKEGVAATYSLKPTSFGLLIDPELCFEYVREIVEKASSFGSFVRIDMEDSACVDAEIELFQKVHDLMPRNVGLVIQAYLKRTPADLKNLVKRHTVQTPLNIRLCKGIYVEPPEIAIQSRAGVNKQYLEMLDFLLRNKVFVGIATHDQELVAGAQQLIECSELKKDEYEFQMLYGVTPDLRSKIVGLGHRMRVYVPFGKHWFGYSTRRLKENPQMAWLIIKALFVRG